RKSSRCCARPTSTCPCSTRTSATDSSAAGPLPGGAVRSFFHGHGINGLAAASVVVLYLCRVPAVSPLCPFRSPPRLPALPPPAAPGSEEHTSALQSRENLVCGLLLVK